MAIQDICERWAQNTLRDQVLKSGGSKVAIDLVLDAAPEAKIPLFYPVTGRVTQGLIKPLAAQGKTGFLFSDLVATLHTAGRLNPGTYSVLVAEELVKNDMPRTLLPGLLARALVSLPSFLRTYDLYERFPALLKKSHSSFRNFRMDVGLNNNDPDDKADFTIKLNLELRLWSFLDSERALNFTAMRLTGERGKLKPGLHLLLPFNRSHGFSNCDWDFYSDAYLQEALTFLAEHNPTPYPLLCRELVRDPGYLKQIQFFHV